MQQNITTPTIHPHTTTKLSCNVSWPFAKSEGSPSPSPQCHGSNILHHLSLRAAVKEGVPGCMTLHNGLASSACRDSQVRRLRRRVCGQPTGGEIPRARPLSVSEQVGAGCRSPPGNGLTRRPCMAWVSVFNTLNERIFICCYWYH